MKKREFLMLAHNYKKSKHGIGGWFLSEKLDGQRCFWDGGLTRGMLKNNVPWANKAKDERLKKEQVCTGLWSRYGNVIHAPDWWLNELPKTFLDGELYSGRHSRQEMMSTVRKLIPDKSWEMVQYCIFDVPSVEGFFKTGRVNNPNFVNKYFDEDVLKWFQGYAEDYPFHPLLLWNVPFRSAVTLMSRMEENIVLQVVKQIELPFSTNEAEKVADKALETITDVGGEGVMLRSPDQVWNAQRVNGMVKLKKLQDAEATVVGYVSGRETDKGSKLLGLMGALIVSYKGIEFELSGFTDQERQLLDEDLFAIQNPGCSVPDSVNSAYFPRGSSVTFRFREHSRDGIPIEARYWRKP